MQDANPWSAELRGPKVRLPWRRRPVEGVRCRGAGLCCRGAVDGVWCRGAAGEGVWCSRTDLQGQQWTPTPGPQSCAARR